MPKRLESLDALRGWNMFMIAGADQFALGGGDQLLIALALAFGFGQDCWLARQMEHVPWCGFHFYDFIYPLFVFISGVTFPFSRASQLGKGMSTRETLWKIAKRVFWLVLLGWCCYGLFKRGPLHSSIWSVLGRIGVSWGIAALLYVFCRLRTRIIVFLGILVSYWLFVGQVTAPGAPPGIDGYLKDHNIVLWLDQFISQTRNQCAFSTYGMVATMMLGMFAGDFLRLRHPCFENGGTRALAMAGAGVMLSLVGWAWTLLPVGWYCPISKILWTSSTVLFFGGWSLLLLAAFYWVIDVKLWTKWAFFFKVIGVNAIALYVGVWTVFNLKAPTEFLTRGFLPLLPENLQPLAMVLVSIAFYWSILYFLYRRQIIFKV